MISLTRAPSWLRPFIEDIEPRPLRQALPERYEVDQWRPAEAWTMGVASLRLACPEGRRTP